MSKLITLSLNNVLLRVSSGVGTEYAKVAANYGIKIDPKEMDEIFRRNRSKFQACRKENITKPCEWWQFFLIRCLKDCGQHDHHVNTNVARHIYLHFATHRPWEAIKEATDLVEKIKSNNLELGLISNMDKRIDILLACFDLYHHFDFIIRPDMVKCEKPDPIIFKEALKYSKAESTVHVDTEIEDYRGAKKAGMKCILISQNKELPPDVDRNDVVPCISHIYDKLGI